MPTTIAKANDVNNLKSADILNTIAESGEINGMPKAVIGDINSLHAIGDFIMQYDTRQNQFLDTLVNRIGRVIITSKLYENPWNMFKKGMLEYGETIEEIFVNLAKPENFDFDSDENPFKKRIPDVKSAFHILNYRKKYPKTVSNDMLRTAFLSWEGITDLIARIIDSMYSAANYDEFLTMKYMLARAILNGYLYPITIPEVTPDNAKLIATTLKGVSNQLEFMSTDYNYAGVYNYTNKNDQILIMNAQFDAVNDINVLASAFNIDRAIFMGNRVLIDSFGSLDLMRLNELFKDDANYVEIGQDDLDLLDEIPAVLVDRDFFMVFDNLYNMTEIYNPEQLYWNYFYHVWKTFSLSPFSNALVFTPTTPAVTGVTVSPATATANKGQYVQLQANVATTGFASTQVVWTIDGTVTPTSTVSSTGRVKIATDEPNTTLTVTAHSTFDTTKTASATITIS